MLKSTVKRAMDSPTVFFAFFFLLFLNNGPFLDRGNRAATVSRSKRVERFARVNLRKIEPIVSLSLSLFLGLFFSLPLSLSPNLS